MGFSGGSDGKKFAYNAGDLDLIPELEDPVEEGMETHSSILAGESPWTEEPGRLQPMGSQRVCQTERLSPQEREGRSMYYGRS